MPMVWEWVGMAELRRECVGSASGMTAAAIRKQECRGECLGMAAAAIMVIQQLTAHGALKRRVVAQGENSSSAECARVKLFKIFFTSMKRLPKVTMGAILGCVWYRQKTMMCRSLRRLRTSLLRSPSRSPSRLPSRSPSRPPSSTRPAVRVKGLCGHYLLPEQWAALKKYQQFCFASGKATERSAERAPI